MGKHREWTFENVIARLKAIRREKVHLAGAEFHQVSVAEPDQQRILDLLGTPNGGAKNENDSQIRLHSS